MAGKIHLYGVVGETITVQSVRAALEQNKSEQDITVYISSEGGDVFQGITIYNLFKNSGKNIDFVVQGLCASIATLIVASGRKVIMNKTSQFMIHNPFVQGATGDAHSLRNTAEQLDKIKNLFLSVFGKRTGLPEDTLSAMYDKETWLTSDEAVNLGFVDEVQDAVALAYIKTDTKAIMEKSIFDKVDSAFKSLFTLLRKSGVIKNMEMTTKDGQSIMIMTEDASDLIGKPVTDAEGAALPEGEYTLTDGQTISVGPDGMITEVELEMPEQPESKTDTETKNEDKPNEEEMKENEQLKAKIAELEAKLADKTTESAQAAATITQFKNELSALATEVKALKAQPAGDAAAPGDAHDKNLDKPIVLNSFGPVNGFEDFTEHVVKHLSAKHLINIKN